MGSYVNFFVMQVRATDSDASPSNSAIRYSRLTGDDPIVEAFRLDAVTGEISVANNQLLDREKMDRKL